MNRQRYNIGDPRLQICPTRVGMNRRNLSNYTAGNGHLPHTRGDEPRAYGSDKAAALYLPHTRGDEPRRIADSAKNGATSAPHAWG